MLDWVLPFALVLSVLIFVHELGHYLVARWCGVRVETFSIGFGPELFGRNDRAGTRWKVSAIPLGGYVKMLGDENDDPTDGDVQPAATEDSFREKTLRQRAAIVAAGPLANLAFALILLGGMFATVGTPMPLPVIGSIQPGSAAEAAGLKVGDVIEEVAGEPVAWFDDVRRIVNAKPGESISIVLQRDGQEIELEATPHATESTSPDGGKPIGLLGIRPDVEHVEFRRLSIGDAVVTAFGHVYDITAQIARAISGIFVGSQGLNELGGPLRIAQISGEVAQDGFVNLLYFMAALSVNLALINLLPIPVLDGGHLFLYAIEAVVGKPLNKRLVDYAFRAGLALILGLMVIATWNDLVSLKVVDFIRGLIS